MQDKKDFNSTNGSKGKTQELINKKKKKIPVEARFSSPVKTGPGDYTASCTMGTGSFPGVKRSGRGVYHPTPSSAEVKERV
jgi:hypothetical protein